MHTFDYFKWVIKSKNRRYTYTQVRPVKRSSLICKEVRDLYMDEAIGITEKLSSS